MTVPMPGADQRWRCSACGNLTRFDVRRTRRTVEFVHVDLAGEQTTEDVEVLADDVAQVNCRWCASTAIELVPRPAIG
jgi:hypothetical protein